ncbi:hypothetical protein HYX13_04300 [Candidatus Woesearchaeota archaeon]|nr:hypothetical protein [Candidatus Woesearchaeota archaeon]
MLFHSQGRWKDISHKNKEQEHILKLKMTDYFEERVVLHRGKYSPRPDLAKKVREEVDKIFERRRRSIEIYKKSTAPRINPEIYDSELSQRLQPVVTRTHNTAENFQELMRYRNMGYALLGGRFKGSVDMVTEKLLDRYEGLNQEDLIVKSAGEGRARAYVRIK